MRSKKCSNCGKKVKHRHFLGSGGYKCPNCGHEELQNQLNQFTDKNGKKQGKM